MVNKIVVITGANDGIGFETAKELAIQGAKIIFISRNEIKVQNAINSIKIASNNDKLQYVLADLMSQKSIRKAANEIHQITDKIDVLINNAGATFSQFELTEDGLEKTIATNHFAYFLLTGLLLDLIKKSENGRIINVSSGAHFKGKIDFQSFKMDKAYFIFKEYRQSKLANVLFTIELAEKLKNTSITVNCLHPGMVKTKIGNKPSMGKFHSYMWSLFSQSIGISAEKGARTSLYLATSNEIKGISGKYFSSSRNINFSTKTHIENPSKIALDPLIRKQLWEITEEYCGFKYSY